MRTFSIIALSITLSGVASAEFTEVHQYLKGVDCAACADTVARTLRGVPGVDSAKVSLHDQVATVKLRAGNKTTIETLREAIRTAGFGPGGADVVLSGTVVERGGKPAIEVSGLSLVYTIGRASSEDEPPALTEGKNITATAYLPEPASQSPAEPHSLWLRELRVGDAKVAIRRPVVAPRPVVKAPPATGAVSGQVNVFRGSAPKADASEVVVYLESSDPIPSSKMKVVLRQKNAAFRPGLVVVPRGATVLFQNDDKVFHNVFSPSEIAQFDLGLYKAGETRNFTFKRGGVADVYCNIHPDMVAKIKVVDTPYYAVVSRDGRFRISGVPPGVYSLVAWQPYGNSRRAEVQVSAGGSATVTVRLDEGEVSTRHLRKDNTPYGRYQ